MVYLMRFLGMEGGSVMVADWCVFNPSQPESSGIALQGWSMRSLQRTAVGQYVTARSSPPVSSRDIGPERLTWYPVPLWKINEHLHEIRINAITENLYERWHLWSFAYRFISRRSPPIIDRNRYLSVWFELKKFSHNRNESTKTLKNDKLLKEVPKAYQIFSRQLTRC